MLECRLGLGLLLARQIDTLLGQERSCLGGDLEPSAFGLRQTGSRMAPPWAAIAQMTKMSRAMMSSDQNG